MRTLITFGLIVTLFTGANETRSWLQHQRKKMPLEASRVIPPKWLASSLFLGNDLLAADFYWLLTITYIPMAFEKADQTKQLEALFRLARDLNPRFCQLYKTAGTFLSQPSSDKLVLVANRFLEEGIRECPDDWLMEVNLGFNLYYNFSNYMQAGLHFINAGKNPQAPPWVNELGMKMLSQTERSLILLEVMLGNLIEHTEDEELKKIYEKRLVTVHDEKLLRQIDKMALDYRHEHGHFPKNQKVLDLGPEYAKFGHVTFDDEGFAQSSKYENRLRKLFIKSKKNLDLMVR